MAIDGFLDDYSHFICGLLEIYRASCERKYLNRAVELMDTVFKHFSDIKGGFFQTDDSSEEMIVRLKEVYDGAIPSSNSVMAMDLVALATLTRDSKYLESAERIFDIFAMDFSKNPAGYAHLLSAFAKSRSNGRLLAIVGRKGGVETSTFLSVAERRYDPDLEIVRYDDIAALPDSLRHGTGLETGEAKSIAYLCSGQVCGKQLLDEKELERALAPAIER